MKGDFTNGIDRDIVPAARKRDLDRRSLPVSVRAFEEGIECVRVDHVAEPFVEIQRIDALARRNFRNDSFGDPLASIHTLCCS